MFFPVFFSLSSYIFAFFFTNNDNSGAQSHSKASLEGTETAPQAQLCAQHHSIHCPASLSSASCQGYSQLYLSSQRAAIASR